VLAVGATGQFAGLVVPALAAKGALDSYFAELAA
jgi:hypothetical protein